MGSKDKRHGRVDIFHQGYVGPLERPPWATTVLEERHTGLGALRTQPVKMATKSHSGGEMPLEQLLALYGYKMPVILDQQGGNEQRAKGLLFVEEDVENSSSNDDLTFSLKARASELLQCHHRVSPGDDKDTSVSCSEDDSEITSIPSSDGHKDIMVGPQYQAVIPPLSSNTLHERPYENEDQLLWTPDVLPNLAVERFLLETQRNRIENGREITGDTVKDNEQALYELVKCDFNAEEALQRYHFNVKVFNEVLCGWSEEECRYFEHGFRAHGKNFHLIQANKVRTRSVGECVEYYYMWKKSERHEYFTQQATKLGRKKCNLPSGNPDDGEPDGEIGDVESATSSTFRSSNQQPPSPPAVPTLSLDTVCIGEPQLRSSISGSSTTETHASIPVKSVIFLLTDSHAGCGLGVLISGSGSDQQREQWFSSLPSSCTLHQRHSIHTSHPTCSFWVI
ncbi:hypothetical protein DNTS_026730 [Danionella cerebrum]|uniref:Mesoderm induction early response protein 2 n=1 Tax=Danionella cerebrum TaxID=2873325 RepID=A0A553RL17_9TELE|nr:hypothetical protein DNTS_026730 [Danionella translucida]